MPDIVAVAVGKPDGLVYRADEHAAVFAAHVGGPIKRPKGFFLRGLIAGLLVPQCVDRGVARRVAAHVVHIAKLLEHRVPAPLYVRLRSNAERPRRVVRVASADVAGEYIRRGQRRVAVSRFAREFVEFEKADADFAELVGLDHAPAVSRAARDFREPRELAIMILVGAAV